MPLLIDGYNLLRAAENQPGSEGINDFELCRMLESYLRQNSESGVIVFDGTGPPNKSGFGSPRSLKIRFSGKLSDADTVIIRIIKENTAPKRLVVVSSDRQIRDAASKRKAVSLASLDFWCDMLAFLNRRRRNSEPRAKRAGLTDGEAQSWMKFFDMDGDS